MRMKDKVIPVAPAEESVVDTVPDMEWLESFESVRVLITEIRDMERGIIIGKEMKRVSPDDSLLCQCLERMMDEMRRKS